MELKLRDDAESNIVFEACTHIHARAHAHTYTHSLSLSQTHALTRTHTIPTQYPNTHTRARTHSLTHTYTRCHFACLAVVQVSSFCFQHVDRGLRLGSRADHVWRTPRQN